MEMLVRRAIRAIRAMLEERAIRVMLAVKAIRAMLALLEIAVQRVLRAFP